MNAIYDVPAPAKLNLFLHVLGRRPDGYHLIQSAFRLIDWCDTLHFERCRSSEVSREDLNEQLPTADLIVRSAQLLQQVTGYGGGARISVVKRIPQEAGLGGGSSDAASCLITLNRLWRLGLSRTVLAEIGMRLGADVPFFIFGTDAWVEGIGERISPLSGKNALPSAQYVVLKPNSGSSTAKIFGSSKLKRDTPAATIAGFVASRFQGHLGSEAVTAVNRKPVFSNDLADVAQSLCPDIGTALWWLASLGIHGQMTGSGSAVFAQVTSAEVSRVDAAWGSSGYPERGWRYRVCNSLQSHPLLGWSCEDDSSSAISGEADALSDWPE